MDQSNHSRFLQAQGISETTRVSGQGHNHPKEGHSQSARPTFVHTGDQAPLATPFSASHDTPSPAATPPWGKIYMEVGAPLLRRLARRHHERLRLTGINGFLLNDEASFESAITQASNDIIVACGGPGQQVSAATLRRESSPPSFFLDDHLRAVWLAELWLAMGDVSFPAKLRPALWEWAETLVLSMLKKGHTPTRYPYDLAGIALARHMHPLPAVFKAL